MKPRLLLDVDGVLADFHTPCIAIINRLMSTNFKVEDFETWDIFDALKVPADVKAKVYDEMNKTGWCTDIGVYPGAKDGVDSLREVADVYICTAPMRGPTWASERDRWLMKHFGFSTRQIIHTSAKYVCAGDFLVDDKVDNLVKWGERHPHGHPIFWMRPQHSSHKWDGLSTHDWDELCEMVRQLPRGNRIWHHV
jgi:5'(3')-deoxyribonucleotidase